MQVKWDCLRAGNYSGTIDDMYLKFLLDAGAITRSMNDAEAEWLAARGFTVGTNDDRWFDFLRNLGYTGSRTDMEHSFWVTCDLAGQGGAGTNYILTENGDTLADELGNILLQE